MSSPPVSIRPTGQAERSYGRMLVLKQTNIILIIIYHENMI